MFKKLKSLFVVEEVVSIEDKLDQVDAPKAGNKEKKQATVKTQTDVSGQTSSIEEEILTSTVNQPVKPQKKFTNILLKAIDSQDLEGPDYLEFKSSLKSLEGVIAEEETRFKSSYAVLQNTGITKANLLSSGKHYLDVLENEKQKFEKTFQEQQSKQVKQKEQKIQQLKAGISKRKEQLKKLLAEIESMEKSMEISKKEINQAATKVQLTKDQFMASYEHIKGQIKSDFDKINQYL